MSDINKANDKDKEQSSAPGSLPPQSSAQDTSNWDDRLFLAPGVANPNHNGKKISAKSKKLIMDNAPDNKTLPKRHKQSKD